MDFHQTSDREWNAPQFDPSSEYLENEIDRWAKLLERPLSLEDNPLRYGELTLYGYYDAREKLKVRSTRWPSDPSAIAKLLTLCKIDTYEIDNTFERHAVFFRDDDDRAGIALALRVHVELSKLHGLERTPEALLKVVEYFEWPNALSYDSFASVFHVMNQYFQSPSDEVMFLSRWLQALPRGRESLGITLVKSFLGTDATELKKWCIESNDTQGLAYLVWQKRLGFRDWLREVAYPSAPLSSRYRHNKGASGPAPAPASLRSRHDSDASGTLFSEQNECFGRLYEKMFLEREYQALLEECPDLLEKLVAMAMVKPDSTESINWMGHLLAIQAFTPDHPLFARWVDSALAAQETLIKNFASNRLSATFLTTYASWRIMFESAGHKCKSLIARHMVTHMRVPAADPIPAEAVGDIEWLRGASVAPALVGVSIHVVDRNQALAKLLGMYPYLTEDESNIVAAFLVNSVLAGVIPADKVFKGLGIPAHNTSATTVLQDMHALMQMLKGRKLESPEEALSSLGIAKGDALYASALHDWVEGVFNVKSVAVSLPVLALDCQ
jgi:hypothetical protein